MRGFAPRFALEAGFLILLGVGAGYADLRPAAIVAIVAGGWVLVALVELAVWRSQARPAVGAAASSRAERRLSRRPVVEPEPATTRARTRSADAGEAPSEEVEAYTRVIRAGADGSDEDAGLPT